MLKEPSDPVVRTLAKHLESGGSVSVRFMSELTGVSYDSIMVFCLLRSDSFLFLRDPRSGRVHIAKKGNRL